MTSKYTFSHTFEKKFKVVTSTDSETAYDIISDFVSFLRGCQFCDSAIADALEAGGEEVRQAARYVDK